MVRQRPYLRQAATVTGLGCEDFEKSVSNMDKIFVLFANHFEPGALDKWNPGFFETFRVIDTHTRYFDRPKTDSAVSAVPFTDFEDPNGFLNDMQDDGFVHSEKNVVEYIARYINGKDGTVT